MIGPWIATNVVATVWSNDPHPAGRPAEEAQFIATAPELLTAIERLHAAVTAVPASNWLHLDADAGDQLDDALEIAWETITKAKGGENG